MVQHKKKLCECDQVSACTQTEQKEWKYQKKSIKIEVLEEECNWFVHFKEFNQVAGSNVSSM